MNIDKAIVRAWTDSAYRARLLSDPHAALAEVGLKGPQGVQLVVVEDTPGTCNLVLPLAPDNAAELSIDEMEKVAGGGHRENQVSQYRKRAQSWPPP